MKGEGRNCELAECAMRRGVSVRAYGGAEEETANGRGGEEACVVSPQNGEEEDKMTEVSQESPQVFVRSLPILKK